MTRRNEARPPVRPAEEPSQENGELDDAALEHVVGGLARAWIGRVPDIASVTQHELTNGLLL